MDVSIIIVNYNTADIIAGCLESILNQKNVSHEIIVVDNASTDQSLTILNAYKDKIKLIANPTNVGFGRANNQAFSATQGRFILLLNPDAGFSNIYALNTLIQFIEQAPKIGIASPKIIKHAKITRPRTSYPGQKFSDYDFTKLPGKIAWVIGACMLIRRETYQQIVGFDEDYFLYGEETDLCLRARKAGWEIGYCDYLAVQHIGGASERNNSLESVWQKKQAGLYLFYQKHYSSHTIKKILKKSHQRAKIRLLFLRLKKLIGCFRPKDLAKLSRYQVICDTSSLQKLSKGYSKQ